MSTAVVAISNQKGGVGKSTSAVNLAAALTGLDRRVLVVDMDPQGNATSGLGIDRASLESSMYEVLLKGADLEDAIEPTSTGGLFVAPATIELAAAEIELVSTMSRELRLKSALEDSLDLYDYVLIDCPPSLGLLTLNGFAAATEVLIPIQCEYYALEGVSQLLKNIELVQRSLNRKLEVKGVLLTMFDGRTNLSADVSAQVREFFGEATYRAVIPRSVKLSEAPSYGEPIESFAPMSRGAIAYRHLASEFVARHEEANGE